MHGIQALLFNSLLVNEFTDSLLINPALHGRTIVLRIPHKKTTLRKNVSLSKNITESSGLNEKFFDIFCAKHFL